MIHLKEKFLDGMYVATDMGGVIDAGTIPVPEAICQKYLGEGRSVLLNPESVMHITREGRKFMQILQDKVRVVNLPEFVKLEHGS